MGTKSTREELIGLEKRFWQAMKDKDARTATSLAAKDCVVCGAQGVAVIDRDSLGAMIDSPTSSLDAFSFDDDAEVRFINDDVAVVAYTVHEDMTVEGEPVHMDAAESSTWVRRDGKWECVQHTEALLGDPYGRDRGRDTIQDEESVPTERSGAV